MTDEPTEPSDPNEEPAMRDDTTPVTSAENIVHFNPWRDFNDAAPQIDVFGDEPDPEQIAQFMQVVFGNPRMVLAGAIRSGRSGPGHRSGSARCPAKACGRVWRGSVLPWLI